MAEGETHPTEGPKPRSKLLLAVVIVVLLLAGGGFAAVLLAGSANQPPTAAFTYLATGLDLSVDASGSSDADGTISAFAWDWGDGSSAAGRAASHTYAAPGAKTVTLTVTDNRGTTGRRSETVQIEDRPIARFTVSRDLIHVDVDGSASQAFGGATITTYAWDWGDGSPAGSGVTASHDYATEGRKEITLTATDSRSATGTAIRVTSVARTTVDVVMYDFFQLPYEEWWYSLRGPVYGDRVLSNATPHTNLYPWAGDLNDTFVYTNFRQEITGRNVSGYSVGSPVFMPVLNGSVPASPTAEMTVDWYFQYIDSRRRQQLIADGWFISNGWMDGFLAEWTMWVAMDYDTSRRTFNVTGDPSAWWAANTVAGPAQGWLDSYYGNWLETLGKDTFDAWNAFEWYYTVFYIDVSAQVVQNPDGTNTTIAKVYLVSWGQEVLIARWFYWGTGTYPDGTPNGWRREEVAWYEDLTFNATLGARMDFDLSGIMGYQFIVTANPGPDGQWKTPDDEPMWAWYPQLMDYIYSEPAHPKSEMDRWIGYEAVNTHPGSPYYGQMYRIDQAFVAWGLVAGETITMILSAGDFLWYRPYTSYWDPGLQTPVFDTFLAPAKFRGFVPAGIGTWDDATRTGVIAGPVIAGGGNPPLEGLPRFEFVPRT